MNVTLENDAKQDLRESFHFYASKRFPHGIYYRIEGDTVQIAAILDICRDPKLIRKILRKR